MIEKYINTSGTEYEVFLHNTGTPKKPKIELVCQRTKCDGVPDAVLNEPYPINREEIEKKLRWKLWERLE